MISGSLGSIAGFGLRLGLNRWRRGILPSSWNLDEASLVHAELAREHYTFRGNACLEACDSRISCRAP
jgi:hypothetical protein